MPALIGRFEHTLDDKSRVFAPSRYREQLAQEGGQRFHVTRGADGCLWLFLPSQWEKFVSDMGNQKFKSPMAKRDFMRNLFETSAEPAPDEQGRITIPQHLKDIGGLRKEIVVIGVGSRAEIWDKAALEKRQKASAKDFDKVLSELDV